MHYTLRNVDRQPLFPSVSGRVLKLLIGYQKCSFLRAILARFKKCQNTTLCPLWVVRQHVSAKGRQSTAGRLRRR